jgi:hypothetical protein
VIELSSVVVDATASVESTTAGVATGVVTGVATGVATTVGTVTTGVLATGSATTGSATGAVTTGAVTTVETDAAVGKARPARVTVAPQIKIAAVVNAAFLSVEALPFSITSPNQFVVSGLDPRSAASEEGTKSNRLLSRSTK